jgi:hypothetical protein
MSNKKKRLQSSERNQTSHFYLVENNQKCRKIHTCSFALVLQSIPSFTLTEDSDLHVDKRCPLFLICSSWANV